jgi:hypothetical protein
MFLDGRLGIAFDSNAVSLRVLKIGHGIVGGFHEEESVASVRDFELSTGKWKRLFELSPITWFTMIGLLVKTAKPSRQRTKGVKNRLLN